jgi:MoxR-like ATPase
VEVGVSPRGIQRTFEAARATALVDGRDYVVPDDVKRVVPVVFAHRLVLTPEADVRGDDTADVVAAVLESVPVPHDGSETVPRGA